MGNKCKGLINKHKNGIYTDVGSNQYIRTMKRNDWKIFKTKSEKLFENVEVDYKSTWGFQEQKNTKWNEGLTIAEIKRLEEYFGFGLPNDYIEMLKILNGFDAPHIAVNPDKIEENEFQRRCYKYPEDLEITKWLIEEANDYIEYAKKALNINGFNNYEIEGFIPLYGHRALVILNDKTKSPVLSIWGNDVIIYGNTLFEYWCNEFGIQYEE